MKYLFIYLFYSNHLIKNKKRIIDQMNKFREISEQINKGVDYKEALENKDLLKV